VIPVLVLLATLGLGLAARSRWGLYRREKPPQRRIE